MQFLTARPTERRSGLFALPVLLLAFLGACTQVPDDTAVGMPADAGLSVEVARMYSAVQDGSRTIPAVSARYIDDSRARQMVDYPYSDAPGTIVVDPYSYKLYLVMEGNRAMRYTVAVGEAGRNFQGRATIRRKEAWPGWTPTQNMIRREPEVYGPFSEGLPGGLDNPLGARALYLYRNGRDTYYRIHGTSQPWSIGRSASSGCIRLFNQDILDLYSRVPKDTSVRVLSEMQSMARRDPGTLAGPTGATLAADPTGLSAVDNPLDTDLRGFAAVDG